MKSREIQISRKEWLYSAIHEKRNSSIFGLILDLRSLLQVSFQAEKKEEEELLY
jgi:hypothetical protein